MKKNGKRWLALLLVAVLAWNEVFAMNVHASEIADVSIADEVSVEEMNGAADGEEITLDNISPEDASYQQEPEMESEELLGATITSVYGPYRNVYVPSGVLDDTVMLSKMAATIPKEAYATLSDGTVQTLAVTGNWTLYGSNFKNTVSTDEGTKDVLIPYSYNATCKNFTAAFNPTQVKPGESYKLKTTADGTRTVRLGYQLSTDSSGTVSAKLRYDSRTTAHTALDSLSDSYTISNALVSDSGEYIFLCFNGSEEAGERDAYFMSSTASIEVRSAGNISKVTGFAQKLYISSAMANTDTLTKLAAVLPQKACIVTDLGDTMDVATAGAWTYNATSGAFENTISPSGLPSGVTDSDNLAGTTTISMPYAANGDCSNISVTANPASVAVGGSTVIYIKRYKTTYVGTWLCKLPENNGSGTIYDTSGSEYDQTESDTSYAFFKISNLQTSDAGTYCGIVADTTSAATSRYAYVSGVNATLTVTGTASCSHTTLTSQFTWSTDHMTCAYKLTCSDCGEVVKEGKLTAVKKTTAATCSTPGSNEYSVSITYNGKTYGDTYQEAIPVVAHTPEASFAWSTDHESCTCSIVCSVCEKEVYSGKATVTKKTNATSCGEAGSIEYTASITYDGKTYSDTYTEITEAGKHTPQVTFTWNKETKTCTYVLTCSVCGDKIQSGDAEVAEEITTPATCSKEGSATYTVSVTYDGKTYSDTYTEAIPKTKHTPKVDFTWNTEAKTCTYSISCSVCNASLLETGDATVTKQTTAATCSKEGSIKYTASVTYDGENYTDIYQTTIATLPHTLTVSPLTWSEDHETCSYKVTCSECSQQIDQGVVEAVKTTSVASCEKEGSIVYTASMSYGGKDYSAEPYTEIIPKLAHKPVVAASKWSDDYSTCTITLGCSVCKNEDIETDTVTSIPTKKVAATCEQDGSITYTASLEYNDVTYDATPYTQTIGKLGHNYVDSSGAEATYRTEGHTVGRACSNCGKAELEENAIPSKAFSITYDGNGSTSGTMSAQTDLHYTVGGNLTKCGYVRDTYEFTGWNSQADGKGVSIDDASDIRDEDLMSLVEANDGKVTLYAQWKRIKCNVAYELNGGENATDNKTSYQLSELPVTLSKPVKTGYVFAGWYTDAEYTNPVTTITKVESDLTLYAKWTEKTYQIEFVGNNATSGAMTIQETSYTDSGNLNANTFQREGYVFTGWNSKSDGSGVAIADASAIASVIGKVEAYGDNNTITLYAQWRKEGVNIYYNLADGTNNSSNPDVFSGEDITLMVPVKPGYTFAGWYSDSSFKNVVTKITYDNLESLLNSDGNISLYAKWTANKYSVKFVGNGATSGTMSAISGTYETGAKLPSNAFRRTGYTFYGWKGSDGKIYKNKADLAAFATSTTPQVITLTARWKLNVYTITYVLNGGTNSSANPASYSYTTATFTFKNPARKGYTFLGWYIDSACTKKVTKIVRGTIGNKKLYAKWKKNVYTLTYVLNGGTSNGGNPTKYSVTNAFALKKAYRKGYTFLGWYTDAKFKTRVTKISKGTTGNRKLYARWKLTKYKITYNLNGGTNSKYNPTYYTYKTSTFTFKKPVKKGYVFVGWYTDSGYKNKISGIRIGTVGNKTLYARWRKS